LDHFVRHTIFQVGVRHICIIWSYLVISCTRIVQILRIWNLIILPLHPRLSWSREILGGFSSGNIS